MTRISRPSTHCKECTHHRHELQVHTVTVYVGIYDLFIHESLVLFFVTASCSFEKVDLGT